MQEYKLYIGGQWTETLSGEQFESANPYTGKLWINTCRNANYASPFGGYKASGYGRENREETVKEYTQVTSVWVETDENVRDPFVVG
jgi:(Z)-2-((N-methylformamido)methylene)-5-hydroxybutyrolactone dehydrogenase